MFQLILGNVYKDKA